MPFIVAQHPDGTTRLDTTALAHDGVTYDGPLFDVPVDVAQALAARHVFRYATAEDVAAAQPAKPSRPAAKKPGPRKTSE